MSGERINYGNGFSGRVDGSLCMARRVLTPGAVISGSVSLERALPETSWRHNIVVPKVIGHVVEHVANNLPLNPQSLSLGLAAAATVYLVETAQSVRDVTVENGIIEAGLSRETAEKPWRRRAMERAKTTLGAVVAGYVAYRTGEQLPMCVDLVASAGLITAGNIYVNRTHRDMTGRLLITNVEEQ